MSVDRMPFVPTWEPRLSVLICGQKRAYPTRWQAEDAAARHFDCPVCQRGKFMGAYACDVVAPLHFHTGHQEQRQ